MLTTLVSVFLTALLRAGASPSAQEILARCQHAYDAVRTFEVDVRGQSGNSTATAHISFSRPGKLRAGGTSLFGAKYEVLVNGSKCAVFNGGLWQPENNAESAVSTVTGIGGTTPTAVSSLLLHLEWGKLIPPNMAAYGVSEDSVANRKCYKLRTTKPFDTSYWFDKQTYFLVRTRQHILSTPIAVDFGLPTVNHPIPAGRFAR